MKYIQEKKSEIIFTNRPVIWADGFNTQFIS